MTTPISVIVPVGPDPRHARYLAECLESVKAQTLLPSELLIVDDMHDLPVASIYDDGGLYQYHMECSEHGFDDRWQCDRKADLWKAPWHLGVAHAFSFGVALAQNELVFLLGADDRLLPTCLEECVKSYEKRGDGYHWVGVEYSDDRPNQYVPCGAAAVTKALWRETGGFPTQSAVGASDAALISILMRHMPEKLICVNKRKPLYWYRSHEESETAHASPWQGSILEVRNRVTELWEKPTWGRYA